MLSLLGLIYVLDFTLTGFVLIALRYVMLDFSTISFNLLIYKFFEAGVMYLSIWFFKVIINLSVITDIPLLCVEYISISLFYKNDFINLL